MSAYPEFFARATRTVQEPEGRSPYPFQCRLAEAEAPDFPSLLNIPTGSGKTAAMILAWLYRRRYHSSPDVRAATPRRLVYCLPMRVLVEQTRDEAIRWLFSLGLLCGEAKWKPEPDREGRLDATAKLVEYRPDAGKESSLASESKPISVHVLMGGEEPTDWSLWPEHDAILIGTQDMLLSRALNRGFGASRFRWPMEFGLLNNDTLWVYDEPQLMGNGVSTSAQLDAFRARFGTFGKASSVWMSATLDPSWLQTVDRTSKSDPFLLTDADTNQGSVLHTRLHARKVIQNLEISSSENMKEIAKAVLQKIDESNPDLNESGRDILVIVNTVDRARNLYQAFKELTEKSESKKSLIAPAPTLLLLHSRFRPRDRQRMMEQLRDGQATGSRIIVSTQVIEAGVDFSAEILVTELAPWASLVQRFGRCNRYGEFKEGHIYWFETKTQKKAEPNPYQQEDLEQSKEWLTKLERKGVSPVELDHFKKEEEILMRMGARFVLRRKDLLDLFDTAPDLSGNDIDVSRFVRGDDPNTDVRVFWRNSHLEGWDRAPSREELCPVPIHQIRAFLKVLPDRRKCAFVWDHIDETWRGIENENQDLYPGLNLLLDVSAGGYSEETGWDGSKKETVTEVSSSSHDEEGTGSDPWSSTPSALTLAEHTRHVVKEVEGMVSELPLDSTLRGVLQDAAQRHDIGKAHPVFQEAARAVNPNLNPKELWAKSGTTIPMKYARRHFRHELASALAVLGQRDEQGDPFPFLVPYLIAAHHGRVRLSIRALPGECHPTDPDAMYALGVGQGDGLPEISLDDGPYPPHKLDLEPMLLGGERSWTAKALSLRDGKEYGVFRVAYLEALLRAADARASKEEARTQEVNHE